MNRLSARLLAPTLAAAVLLAPAVAQAKPAAPKATAPKVGTTVQNMPALTWNAAKGAAQYEVQIASDSGFNPALIDVTTQNLRFVNAKMLPNGAYFWRVRSIDAASDSSKWSSVRKFTKKWNAVAALLTPASLNTVLYPNPAILTWTPVPGAVTYRVSVASGAAGGGVDAPGGVISKGALAWNDGGNPITTSNTNLAVSASLHPGTYYWQVVPVDAEGNAGAPSQIFSFVWIWPGTTTPTVTDMVPGVEIYDPLFKWDPIPGAASYEMEVNTTSGFATGSKLFSATTSATSYAPTGTLPNNTYYWRVRGLDPQGQAGPWNNGPTFDKTYDQTVVPGPPNLTVLNSKLQPIAPGGNVNEPVVTWSTVPGARHYEVQTACSGSTTIYSTANTAWTPFSQTGNPGNPQFFNAPNVSVQTGSPLPTGNCTVFVRAFTDSALEGTPIAGPYASTTFHVGGEAFNNPPTVDCAVSGSSCDGRLNPATDVISPALGGIVNKSPLICWKPADMNATGGAVTPSTGYWVAIARDSNFTTVVQAAYTDEPCYAPRSPLVDEGTLYYWQVIPTVGGGGGFTPAAGLLGGFTGSPNFQHASVPPTPVQPVGGASASGTVLFQWSPVPEQVKNYTIEISADSSFSSDLDSATTDATAWAASHIYPVGTTLYWRVRANNDDSSGLAWSGTSTFVQTLPVPTITTASPFLGATFPALTWPPVDGATGYEIQNVWPDGSAPTTTVPSAAASYTKMTGTGHGTVQVRALFGSAKSAYTPTRDVVHTIAEPGGTKTQLINKPGKLALTFAWNTKTNAKQYKVQVSRNPGFVQPFLDEQTDQSSYTPVLSQQDFVDGGAMYWRVAVVDPDGNVGAFSKAKKFTLLARMQVTIGNQPPHGQRGSVVITVVNAKGKPIKGVAVKLRGAGVKTGTHRTNKKGIATFAVKPTKTGNLTATATKKLYKVGTAVAAIS